MNRNILSIYSKARDTWKRKFFFQIATKFYKSEAPWISPTHQDNQHSVFSSRLAISLACPSTINTTLELLHITYMIHIVSDCYISYTMNTQSKLNKQQKRNEKYCTYLRIKIYCIVFLFFLHCRCYYLRLPICLSLE